MSEEFSGASSWASARRHIVAALSLSLLALAACQGKAQEAGSPGQTPSVTTNAKDKSAVPAAAPSSVPLTIVTATGNRIALQSEIADTPEARARGLMHRRSLGRYAAMLFPMGSDADWSFYMRNTLIPLDMLFLDAQGTVVGLVEDTRPLDETPCKAGVPSRFVLEVNANFSKDHGIGVGARVELPAAYSTP